MNLIGAWRRRLHERELLYGPKVLLPGGPERWIEDSLDWLIARFGIEPLRRPPVVPSRFVPAGYDGSERAARDLGLKVCAWMEIPDDRIRFSFRLEEVRAAARSAAVPGPQATMTSAEVNALRNAGFAAEIDVLAERQLQNEQELADSEARAAWLDLRPGGQQATAVLLSASMMADPAAVVAATAHELGHEVLSGYHFIDPARPDAEALADLFAVFHGFGVFLANQAVERIPMRVVDRLAARIAGRSTLQRLGYLGERGAADALASYLFRRHLLWPQSILPSMPPELDRAVRLRTFARLATLVKEDEIAAIQDGAPLR
ncbi:hypothetical protein [Kribbella sp. NPDC048915]|uniref:hypothetical protein n=1 Tax=Kribbella sp. NPDC048915 TaxID=3155148 RepID=UPI0033E8578D